MSKEDCSVVLRRDVRGVGVGAGETGSMRKRSGGCPDRVVEVEMVRNGGILEV